MPITGRRQVLLSNAEQMVIESNSKTTWYKAFVERPRLSQESKIAKIVQAILDELSKAEAAQGYNFKIAVCDDFHCKSYPYVLVED